MKRSYVREHVRGTPTGAGEVMDTALVFVRARYAYVTYVHRVYLKYESMRNCTHTSLGMVHRLICLLSMTPSRF